MTRALNKQIRVNKNITNKKSISAVVRVLKDLSANGSVGVPTQDQVLRAPNGTSWSGWRKNNQDRWFLVKHGPESYNAEF